MFSLTLAAESAATVAGAGSAAYVHLDRVRDLSRTALDELRALVDTDVDREGSVRRTAPRQRCWRFISSCPAGGSRRTMEFP